jgi:hypothetical protein
MDPFKTIATMLRAHLSEIDAAYFVEALAETTGPLPTSELLPIIQAMPPREIARLLMLALADRLSDDCALALGPSVRLSDQH